MKIILAPAKKMKEEGDLLPARSLPELIARAEVLKERLSRLSYEEAKQLWKCSDKIAEEAYRRLRTTDLRHGFTPAVLAYDGIQYRYLAAHILTQPQLCYLERHVRILSGLYGILRPMDGVVPYRLEMQANTEKLGFPSLYGYWSDMLYRSLARETDCVLNLASKEYAVCIEPYLEAKMQFITCIFGERKGDRVIQKGTKVKMARGEMVRFLAENKIEQPCEAKQFEGLGYRYDKERSTQTTYVFVEEEKALSGGALDAAQTRRKKKKTDWTDKTQQ